jgi:hypothetical protein
MYIYIYNTFSHSSWILLEHFLIWKLKLEINLKHKLDLKWEVRNRKGKRKEETHLGSDSLGRPSQPRPLGPLHQPNCGAPTWDPDGQCHERACIPDTWDLIVRVLYFFLANSPRVVGMSSIQWWNPLGFGGTPTLLFCAYMCRSWCPGRIASHKPLRPRAPSLP